MDKVSGHSLALCAILTLALLASCAEQAAAPTPQATAPAAATAVPQLAGAWYQVQFDSSQADIDARGHMIVNTVANVVANNAATHVTVIGKADRVGSATANLALSQQRAGRVRDALITAGVPSGRIDTRWTGEGNQEIATSDQIADQRNRVVDITVVQEAR